MDFDMVKTLNDAVEEVKKNPSIEKFIALQEEVNKQIAYPPDREILTNTINAEIDKLDPSRNIDMVIPRLEMVSSQISNLTPEQLGEINRKINDIEEPKKTRLSKIISAITVPTKRSMFSMFGRGTRRKRKASRRSNKRA